MSKTLTQLEAADFINRSFKPLPRSYGDALVEAALRDERIVALCADLVPPTETDRFRDELPDRFLDTGIAEANMIGMAAVWHVLAKFPSVIAFAPLSPNACWTKSPCRPLILTYL